MNAIGRIAGHGGSAAPTDIDPDRATQDTPLDENSAGEGLDRLLNQPSALDRLVADAGTLAKFKADQPESLPSGTSSFTVPVSQTIAHIEARMASPNERMLGAPRTAELREAVAGTPLGEAAGLDQPRDTQRAHLVTPRPDVVTDSDNRTSAFTRGSLPARDAS